MSKRHTHTDPKINAVLSKCYAGALLPFTVFMLIIHQAPNLIARDTGTASIRLRCLCRNFFTTAIECKASCLFACGIRVRSGYKGSIYISEEEEEEDKTEERKREREREREREKRERSRGAEEPRDMKQVKEKEEHTI